ncbi:MAG TPA: hypothetical protein VK562_05860 [Candidatus Acidoferrum sp.]|nr:hypothetical protein [Candidatus Acidoferrum sp.]
MHVILSEAKDLTVGIRVYSNELKINEEKDYPTLVRKYCPPMRGPSLRS